MRIVRFSVIPFTSNLYFLRPVHYWLLLLTVLYYIIILHSASCFLRRNKLFDRRRLYNNIQYNILYSRASLRRIIITKR